MQQDQNVACKSMSRTPLNAFASYAWLTLSGEAEKLWQTCPYSQVIHARYLLEDSFRNNEIIKSAFRSVPNGGQAELPRIVFYGTDFFAASDPIDSPTHHTVAGVYYHAMALDNLLTLGTNYTKAFSITSQLNESVGRWFRELDSLNPDRIHKNQDGLYLGYLLYSLISIYFILSMILLNRHLKDSEIYKSESKFKFYGYHKNNRYFSSIVFIYCHTAIYLSFRMIIDVVMYGSIIFIRFYVFRLAPINCFGIIGLAILADFIEGRRIKRAKNRDNGAS